MPALLLVRHGRAGDRREWDGPDELRPLDDRGWAQARRLAAVLPLFGPTAVFSAERIRCRQTVAPLAEALGLPVESLPELGEEEFRDDPEAGLDVVTRLLAPRPDPGVTVVCSQGGAIPSVLDGPRRARRGHAASSRRRRRAASGCWAAGPGHWPRTTTATSAPTRRRAQTTGSAFGSQAGRPASNVSTSVRWRSVSPTSSSPSSSRQRV